MANQHSNTSNRGFASMDEDKQRDIASKGGHESGGNFAKDPQRASEAVRGVVRTAAACRHSTGSR
ncbi:MAG: general stress protein [Methylovirgula sp.]|uniref:general stress protein n=1 Tax=Methylovirgula sp. TaxID=1978224 RepID=UPI0030764795